MEYIWIKNVKCAGCDTVRYFSSPGLRIKYNPQENYKWLLACSSNCAEKFADKTKLDNGPGPDVIMTKNGPIPYRKITQTLDQ
jgi:hypothetical protein